MTVYSSRLIINLLEAMHSNADRKKKKKEQQVGINKGLIFFKYFWLNYSFKSPLVSSLGFGTER